MSVPDFIARAIEAQGKTTVDDVLAVLRDTKPDPPEPMQTSVLVEIGPTTVIEGEVDPYAYTDDHCAQIDAERSRRAIANGSKPKKGSDHTVYAGAKAERDFAKYCGGVWVDPLMPRAQGKVDVRDRHGREFDVKNQRDATLSMDDDDTIYTYFAQHLLVVRPGWKQHRDLVQPHPVRGNPIIWAASLPPGYAVDVEEFFKETP